MEINLENMLEIMKPYEDKKIRTVWVKDEEKYYISVVDIVGVLTESKNPQVYWRVMKKRLKAEGNETVTNCNALKLKASDGKMRLTDARIKLEEKTGKKTVTSMNRKNIKELE